MKSKDLMDKIADLFSNEKIESTEEVLAEETETTETTEEVLAEETEGELTIDELSQIVIDLAQKVAELETIVKGEETEASEETEATEVLAKETEETSEIDTLKADFAKEKEELEAKIEELGKEPNSEIILSKETKTDNSEYAIWKRMQK